MQLRSLCACPLDAVPHAAMPAQLVVTPMGNLPAAACRLYYVPSQSVSGIKLRVLGVGALI